MADDKSKLGPRTGVLSPSWVQAGVLLALCGMGFTFYGVVFETVARQTLWLVLLPSMILSFGLPRYAKRVGIALHAQGLAFRSEGKARTVLWSDVDAIRWDDEPSALVLSSGADVPLPRWLGSSARARRALDHCVRRESPTVPAED